MNHVMPGPDYILDVSSLDRPTPQPNAAAFRGPRPGRPWLAIRWNCCSTYSRIYRNADATAYEGRCPKCGKFAQALIGAGGSDQRFFEAG